MGTGYTENSDSWYGITDSTRAGQSFEPQTGFELHYLRLYLRQLLFPATLHINVYEADGFGHPVGAPISSCVRHMPWGFASPLGSYKTFTLSPCAISADTSYFIEIYIDLPALGDNIAIGYDNADATYAHGHRSTSVDSGASWDSQGSDDHCFFIWGTPWAIPPEPPPPDDRWVPMDHQAELVTGGYDVTLHTDSPCHIRLYWTDQEPWTHRAMTTRRGLTIPWDTYWCYVAWQVIDQNEAGDTDIHTYTWREWETCQTKWYRFRGDIFGMASPSDSPIFHLHYVAPAYIPPVDYPVSLPYTSWGSKTWMGNIFQSPNTATPSEIRIWIRYTSTGIHDCDVYIEESDPVEPDHRPYVDQSGHVLASYTIPGALLRSNYGQYIEYICPVPGASPLTAGTWYAITRESKDGYAVYTWTVKNELPVIDLDCRITAISPSPPNRIWTVDLKTVQAIAFSVHF